MCPSFARPSWRTAPDCFPSPLTQVRPVSTPFFSCLMELWKHSSISVFFSFCARPDAALGLQLIHLLEHLPESLYVMSPVGSVSLPRHPLTHALSLSLLPTISLRALRSAIILCLCGWLCLSFPVLVSQFPCRPAARLCELGFVMYVSPSLPHTLCCHGRLSPCF